MSTTEQGVTPPAQEPKGANPRLEQWRVTIQRVRPQLIGVVVLTLGLILGLGWAYVIAPTIWTDAQPIHLHASYQQEWVKMVADQYTQTRDAEHARNMLSTVGNAQAIVDELIASNSADAALVGRLNAIRSFAPGAENPELAKLSYGTLQTLNPIVLIVIVLVVGSIAVILWGMYAIAVSMIVKGLVPKRRAKTDEATAQASKREAERRRITQEAAQQRETTAPQQIVAGPPPIAQFVSAYLAGDDYYDDSFSIEDEDGGFLGETGAGISETIGVGAPKKVAAIEIWLFDKNDIKTVTKVIMSEHAYRDEAMRAKLAPKGEAVVAQPGMKVALETQTLRIIATIRNLQYGTGALPPNSFFDNLTLDIEAHAKEGASSAPGTAISDMYDGARTSLQ
jgi:hypothetical protein